MFNKVETKKKYKLRQIKINYNIYATYWFQDLTSVLCCKMWNFMQFTWQRRVPTGSARLKLLDPFAGYFCARRTKSTQNAVYKSSSYSTQAFVPDKKLQSQPSKYGHAQKVIKVFFTAPSTFTFHFHSSLLSLSVPCLFFLCWKYTRFHFLAKRFFGDTGEPKIILKEKHVGGGR